LFSSGGNCTQDDPYYNSQLSAYGITIVQSWVLFYLSANSGSSLKDIAAALQLDSPVVTGLIDRLVKEDLVSREEDPEDRRSLRICLTSRGLEVVQEITPIIIEYNHASVVLLPMKIRMYLNEL
jgi:DNA-binding MarR family transcriptional regulator